VVGRPVATNIRGPHQTRPLVQMREARVLRTSWGLFAVVTILDYYLNGPATLLSNSRPRIRTQDVESLKNDRMKSELIATIWCDGAARKRPNPGHAGAGYVIEIKGMNSIEEWIPLGVATNNVAEYEAVIRALRDAADRGVTQAQVWTDSPVVYGHYTNPKTCKAPHLRVLLRTLQEQVRRFPGGISLQRIPRDQNRRADRLARMGRDASQRGERFV
jgi:ribonuclease HI